MNRMSGLQSPSPIVDPKKGFPAYGSRNSSFSNMTTLAEQPSQHVSDQPTFSPFPPLRNRPANVPPSDEEKEGILEKARAPVLKSDDPEIQLSWAQDTLAYVEIASQNDARLSENQPARSQTPHTEHQLRVDAVNIVSFLADQHHPKAEFLRGMWLEFGKFNFRMNKKEAYRCYQRAAQRGYARAEYRMGMQFESSNDPEKAIKHYQLGVQAGDSASHYRLGMMTLLGQHGQPLDYPKGIKLVSYAAETADENAPQGAYVFGMLQARELTQITLPEQYLPLNISGARFNIEKAAYLGFAKAQTKMGVAYELCQIGCDFNPALSLHYNALASKQGEPEADMSISKWFLCGYEGVFEKSEELAFKYARRAAQNDLATAEFAMGYFYEVGIYVRPDLKTSRTWYEKAADHGNTDAAARIDGISRSKTLSRKDHENVTVAKIQSQYGSHRGKRPERFKNPSAPMPTIPDSPIDMPEPRMPQPRPYEQRTSSRPPSAVPYPTDDARGRPPARLPNVSAYSNPNLRASAHIRPTSPAESETSFGDANYRGSSFPTFKPQQALGPQNPGAGRGRGAPPPNAPGAQGPHAYRQPGPGHVSPRVPGSPALNPWRPQTAVSGSPATSSARPHTAQPPAIDIGFSAPPDFAGADRRRLQKPDNPNMRPPQPGPIARKQSYEVLPMRSHDRVSSLPQPPSISDHGRTASPNKRPMTANRPGVTLQDGPPMRPDTGNPPNPPKIPNPDKPSGTPPPTAKTARPPGEGPKTFQEMGVPASKNESDCVSLLKAPYMVRKLLTTAKGRHVKLHVTGKVFGTGCIANGAYSSMKQYARVA